MHYQGELESLLDHLTLEEMVLVPSEARLREDQEIKHSTVVDKKKWKRKSDKINTKTKYVGSNKIDTDSYFKKKI